MPSGMAQKIMTVKFGAQLGVVSNYTINDSGNYSSTVVKRYLNIPKLMSKVDRKNHRHFDNKGYLLNYAVSITQMGPGYRSLYSGAANNWVTKNAGRKWHAARMSDFAKMGIGVKDLGEYNRTIRPYLDYAHSSGTEVTLTDHDDDTISGGEWTYTKLAAPSGDSNTNQNDSSAGPQSDEYELVLTGVHGGATDASGRERYTHVSMTRSYVESRRSRDEAIGSASPGEHTTQDPSPLLQFMQDSVAGGVKTEILEDMQDEGAPYPGALASDSTAITLQLLGSTETTSNYRRDGAIILAPGGLVEIRAQTNGEWKDASGTLQTVGPRYLVEVIGVTRAEG